MQQDVSRPGPAGDVRELLGVLRKRKWSILLLTILTVGSALFFTYRQTPTYESSAQVLVTPTNVNQVLQGSPAASWVNMDTEQVIAGSSGVALLAADRLGATVGDVQGAITVGVRTNTQFLDITYTSAVPSVAQAGAQAVAESYLQFREQAAIDDATRAVSGYREQLGKLEGQIKVLQSRLESLPPRSAEAIELSSQIEQRRSSADFLQSKVLELSAQSIDPGQIVANAALPTAPSSPNPVRNGALALIVGLALGIGLAFLRERLDDRLTGREDLEQRLGAPVLAIVPKISGWRRREKTPLVSVRTPKSSAAEAYRTIRTNLQFIARDGSFKVIAITSASQGEGKTTTVANLAVTLAQTGKRVLAISCDLRKPRLHQFFGLTNDVGLSTVLQGRSTVLEAAQQPKDIQSLRVIASGPSPADSAELLASDAMEALLRDLRPHADFILLDTAPILAVSDSLALAPLCDGFVVLADAGSTSGSAVAHAREQLQQIGADIVGGILNNFDPSNAKYYDYPGRYRYYAYEQPRGSLDGSNGSNGSNGRRRSDSREADLWR